VSYRDLVSVRAETHVLARGIYPLVPSLSPQTYIFLAAGEAEDEAETDGERDREGTKLFLK